MLLLLVADERVGLGGRVAEEGEEDEPEDADAPEEVEHGRPVLGGGDEEAADRVAEDGAHLGAGVDQGADLGTLGRGHPVGEHGVQRRERRALGGLRTSNFRCWVEILLVSGFLWRGSMERGAKSGSI